MKIGILGCGNISNTYIQEIKRLYQPLLEIQGVADLDLQRVKETAEKFGIPGAYTVEELLADSKIALIINLTPPMAHASMNRKILEAGKHVFCEKPFALTVEEAQEVAALAEEKGLMVGAAPDTFLTAPMQSCRKMLEDGWIGKPLYVTANMMSSGVETWHPAPKAFYAKGGGPLFDMAPYYLSALVNLFGPVEEVFAYGGKAFEERRIYSQPLRGASVPVEVMTHYTAVLKMCNGVLVNMNMSFDIWHSSLPNLEIYGTEGTMTLPDPNYSDGNAKIFRKEQVIGGTFGLTAAPEGYEMPLQHQSVAQYTRGCGVAEMAVSIEKGRKNRANVQIGIHIVEVINKIIESAESGNKCKMETTCEQPQAWDWTTECL